MKLRGGGLAQRYESLNNSGTGADKEAESWCAPKHTGRGRREDARSWRVRKHYCFAYCTDRFGFRHKPRLLFSPRTIFRSLSLCLCLSPTPCAIQPLS